MEYLYLATIVILFIGSFIYTDRQAKRFEESKKDLIRELSKSLMAKDVSEYVDSIPNNEPLPSAEETEYAEVDQIQPQELLESLKK